MPTYEYACPAGHKFDVIKSMSELDRPEPCPECSQEAERRMPSRFGFTGASDWNRIEMNHGLGVACTPRQAEKIAKAKGFEPIGNTSLEAIHKDAETKQRDIREQHYRDAANMKV